MMKYELNRLADFRTHNRSYQTLCFDPAALISLLELIAILGKPALSGQIVTFSLHETEGISKEPYTQ